MNGMRIVQKTLSLLVCGSIAISSLIGALPLQVSASSDDGADTQPAAKLSIVLDWDDGGSDQRPDSVDVPLTADGENSFKSVAMTKAEHADEGKETWTYTVPDLLALEHDLFGDEGDARREGKSTDDVQNALRAVTAAKGLSVPDYTVTRDDDVEDAVEGRKVVFHLKRQDATGQQDQNGQGEQGNENEGQNGQGEQQPGTEGNSNTNGEPDNRQDDATTGVVEVATGSDNNNATPTDVEHGNDNESEPTTERAQTTNITVSKVWDDADNQDGLRPNSAKVRLVKNGTDASDTVVLNKDNGWKYTWKDQSYVEGDKFTVKEIEPPAKYEVSIAEKANGEFVVTNTHKPATGKITVTKVWEDNNNKDKIRPSKITVNLMADGEKVESVNVTEKDGWKYVFRGLPVNKNGKAIKYSVTEDAVDGYKASYDGFTIKNARTTQNSSKKDDEKDTETKISITIKKVWDDDNNVDKARPSSITVHLKANGSTTQTVKITEKDNWTSKITNLEKYDKDGKLITYTIEEDAVDGYKTTYDGFTIKNVHTSQKDGKDKDTGKDKDDDVKTGDRTNIIFYIVLLALTAVVGLAVATKKHKKDNDSKHNAK